MLTSRRARRRSYAGPRRGAFAGLRDGSLAIAILALLALLAARLDRPDRFHAVGTAIVSDGDTLSVNGERIRLRGIDAPEFGQTCRNGTESYPCGRVARERLRELIGEGPVSCSGRDRDRYGRLLAACMASGKDLNSALVEAGWAVAFGAYAAEERRARDGRLGLWAGAFERPRDWREQHGDATELEHRVAPGLIGWLLKVLGIG